jgi:hypothetical protein
LLLNMLYKEKIILEFTNLILEQVEIYKNL